MQYSIYDQTHALKLAHQLLDIKAVKLQPHDPFQWASGWKSPIYCDNRLTLSFVDIRSSIKNQLSNAVQHHFTTAHAISGVATAGIAQGALVADCLKLPFSYVRSKPKGHGMGNQIEGNIHPGQQTVVLEDLVSTGKSSLEAVKALREAGVEIAGMIAIFTYGFPQAEVAFKEAGVSLTVLTDYDTLLQAGMEKNIIKSEHLELLSGWKQDPENWGK